MPEKADTESELPLLDIDDVLIKNKTGEETASIPKELADAAREKLKEVRHQANPEQSSVDEDETMAMAGAYISPEFRQKLEEGRLAATSTINSSSGEKNEVTPLGKVDLKKAPPKQTGQKTEDSLAASKNPNPKLDKLIQDYLDDKTL